MATVDKILSHFWSHLDDRQKDVLVGRFGIENGDSSTLAELGKKYGITRERVRQIESGALGTLREKASSNPVFAEFAERNKKYMKNAGGVSRKEHLLEHHRDSIEGLGDNHLSFFIETEGSFSYHPEDKDFWPFYYSDKESLNNARGFIVNWEKFLKARKDEILSEPKYHVHFKVFVKKLGVNPTHAENYVAISKKFHTNNYGDTGLSEWPEIKPVTIRDHIYLILKKEDEPIHFMNIAKLIGERGKGKQALGATVHNELIKDPRFVLVGRGIYGLSENGYKPGTAREVIQRILKESGPMRTKELIAAVQKERFFKPNTVLVNLQNKKFFLRQPDGTYIIKKK
ncbi:MAG TPA: sigma factor-like helix-turn-helix DNA-binding protein [Candidatus Paceibacterota bacterium]|nr:sigma factor-like helix-turn-helix DNA-binding protein [Candidatus Paceibacterota bacterium]